MCQTTLLMGYLPAAVCLLRRLLLVHELAFDDRRKAFLQTCDLAVLCLEQHPGSGPLQLPLLRHEPPDPLDQVRDVRAGAGRFEHGWRLAPEPGDSYAAGRCPMVRLTEPWEPAQSGRSPLQLPVCTSGTCSSPPSRCSPHAGARGTRSSRGRTKAWWPTSASR